MRTSENMNPGKITKLNRTADFDQCKTESCNHVIAVNFKQMHMNATSETRN